MELLRLHKLLSMHGVKISTLNTAKLRDGCKSAQVYALNPAGNGGGDGDKLFHHLQNHLRVNSIRSKLGRNYRVPNLTSSVAPEILLPYGLPVTDLLEPKIEPCLKSVDFVETLADVCRRLEDCRQFEKSGVYLEQCGIFRRLSEPKLFRRVLRSARERAVDVHSKVVPASWLRFERRDDELIGTSSMDCCGRNIECPKATLASRYDPESTYDPCMCSRTQRGELDDDVLMGKEECSTSLGDGDTSFCFGDKEVRCIRSKIALLSRPFSAMLYGGFRESKREKINFAQNGIPAEGMGAVEIFSRTRKIASFDPQIVLEVLSFANKFCCEELKFACDIHLASLVNDMEDAMLLIDYGLVETAYLLVAACLQMFLRKLPSLMHNPSVMKYFCSSDARQRLALVGHASLLLYYFLSQIAMDEDMKSNTTVMLLERLTECASESWQKQLACHQLGVVMLERKE
ncbi:hypothetical protein SLEP1_g31956 [Rubroshorea leprosula]|uniref:BTB domain-containing protein n=1 Tax=Rubroshorea leprosula TaxID=152421 RepID=A0AAV5KBT4_9ROSI|nr:hypothetical protein SLEP1_g31956 [Rubroshorea leprosula]